MTETDFKSKEEIMDGLSKGARMQIKVAITDNYPRLDKDDKLEQEVLEQYTHGMEYLNKIIEECQSEGIDILLTYLPFPASEERQREANTIYDIASNINYVNFLELDVVNYITENYDVTDHRQDAAYMSWNDDYDAYMDYKIGRLKELQELDRYLMMIADKNLSCCIYINENVATACDERMKELIANISKYSTLKQLDNAIAFDKSYFLIVDNAMAEVFESVGGEAIDIPNSTFGHVEFGTDDEKSPYLYIQDGENNYIDGNNDVSVVVIDKYTGSVEDATVFTVYDKVNYGLKKE